MSPRFVLITDHGAHGQRLARVLGEQGIALQGVVFHSKWPKPKTKGVSTWARSMILKARSRWGFTRSHKSFYSFLGTRVSFVDDLDGRSAVRMVQRLAPDYIIVGSGHILKQPLIEMARCGVLNSHPGLLPWMRGSGVVGHCLEQGVPIGATLHYIDVGIDTGAIIERRLLPIAVSRLSWPELEEQANQLAANLMVDVVARIAQDGQKPAATAQRGRFPLFRWPDDAGRRRLNALALSGRSLELFNAWKSHTGGEPDWVVPSEMMESPVPLSPKGAE